MRSVAWHEKNVLKKAKQFCRVFVTTHGFGKPVAQAGHWLNEAVEQYEAAKYRERVEKRLNQPCAGCGIVPCACDAIIGPPRDADEVEECRP